MLRVTLYIASYSEAAWNNTEPGNQEYYIWQRKKSSKLISVGLIFPIDKMNMLNTMILLHLSRFKNFFVFLGNFSMSGDISVVTTKGMLLASRMDAAEHPTVFRISPSSLKKGVLCYQMRNYVCLLCLFFFSLTDIIYNY